MTRDAFYEYLRKLRARKMGVDAERMTEEMRIMLALGYQYNELTITICQGEPSVVPMSAWEGKRGN